MFLNTKARRDLGLLSPWALSILFTVGALFSSAARATGDVGATEAECSTVDLRPLFGPARDQGDIGWCYANATADLLTYLFRDQLGGERASAAYTALVYNSEGGESADEEGGEVDVAFRRAGDEGICPESIERHILETGPRIGTKEKLEKFLELKRLYDSRAKSPWAEAEFKVRLETYRAQRSSLFELPTRVINELFRQPIEKFPLQFANDMCNAQRKEVRGPLAKMKTYDKERFGSAALKLTPIIHQQLDAHRPVAVYYAANFLNEQNFWAPPRNYSLNNVALDGTHDFFKAINSSGQRKRIYSWVTKKFELRSPYENLGRHASLIVGRKWSASRRRCEFILRNSWGTSCNVYPATRGHRGDDRCEAGAPFVSDRFFETQVYGTVVFDN